eukprot:GHVU01056267.1.p1 GENE.GHVU01056267.1~~GHVU01056267.1.p1  ORF type:complete len:102 (+),score=15.93 GHVU01056267.1:236-541(+)
MSSPPPSRATAPSQPQQYAAPPPAKKSSGMLSGLMSSVVGGIGSGVGFGVANRAVDAVMGPRKTEVIHPQAESQPALQQQQQGERCQLFQDDLNQVSELPY